MKVFQAQKPFEKTGTSLMCRFKVPDDAGYGQQADISTIVMSVIDTKLKKKVIDDLSLTVSSVVYNTLQTDARWTDENGAAIDAIGYNFRYDTLRTHIPNGGTTYLFEFYFTPVSGEPFAAAFEVEALNLFGR